MACYGIAVPAEELAHDPGEDRRGGAVGRTSSIKIASPDIHHKSDIGGVRLGLSDPEEVRKAAAETLAAAARHAPKARIDGISVQQMAKPGVEMVLGVKNDRQFGPLIAVGLGGILVELLQDTAVRLAPVGKSTARRMIESLKGYALLSGYRGRVGVDADGLLEAICRLSELADDLKDVIDQIDVNPVIVSENGVMAADGLVILRP